MQINLNGGRICQVKGIDRFQNTSEEPVTSVTKNRYPLSRMTYVGAVQKGTNVSKLILLPTQIPVQVNIEILLLGEKNFHSFDYQLNQINNLDYISDFILHCGKGKHLSPRSSAKCVSIANVDP